MTRQDREQIAYPPARRQPVIEDLHGRKVCDPYRWLEAGDSAECVAWLAGQADLLAAHAPSWPQRAMFRGLVEELIGGGGVAVPVVTPPVWRGRRRFFLHRAADQELPVLMVAGTGEPERALIDPLALDPSGLTTLDAWRPSWTGDLLAYQISRNGDEQPTLWVMDVPGRRVVDGPLVPGRVTPTAWLPTDAGFYYVTLVKTPCHGPAQAKAIRRQVRLHRLGEDPDRDAAVFETDFPQLSVKISPDGRWLMLSCAPGAQSGNALWLAEVPAGREHAPQPRLIHDGTADDTRAVLKFGPGGRIYAVTDADAPFGRLCAVDPADPRSSAWLTVVAQDPPAVLTNCVVLSAPDTAAVHLLVSRSRHGAAELSVHDGEGRKITDVQVPGPGTITGLTSPPHGADEAWFTYTDFVTPPAVYRVGLHDRRCRLETPNPSPIVEQQPHPTVCQVTYPSPDGTQVRMYLIVPPSCQAGPRPTILTAYGGFGASSLPAYSPTILAWVRAGGIYAIAGVRGGGEQGTAWHAAGSGPNKPNAFADFIAAARWLIDHGWTTPHQLAIKGASHSGLIVAAAITQRPDLFAAAVCSDAITDMIRYPHFGLGRSWLEEFGDPGDPAQLDVLLGYSPYHNVRPGTAYPAVLLTCPRVDPRVDSMHTRKMTAALQHATTSGKPILLRCEEGVGHGPRAASRWAALQADALAFCAAHTGLGPIGDGS